MYFNNNNWVSEIVVVEKLVFCASTDVREREKISQIWLYVCMKEKEIIYETKKVYIYIYIFNDCV